MPLAQVGADERAYRDDAEVLGAGPVEREFNQRIADMASSKFFGHFGMNQFQRLWCPPVRQKRRVSVSRQLETTRRDVVIDRGRRALGRVVSCQVIAS
jgi:hypothetical protein